MNLRGSSRPPGVGQRPEAWGSKWEAGAPTPRQIGHWHTIICTYTEAITMQLQTILISANENRRNHRILHKSWALSIISTSVLCRCSRGYSLRLLFAVIAVDVHIGCSCDHSFRLFISVGLEDVLCGYSVWIFLADILCPCLPSRLCNKTGQVTWSST